jgi:F0F1-type ATP synthase epsilon subunit
LTLRVNVGSLEISKAQLCCSEGETEMTKDKTNISLEDAITARDIARANWALTTRVAKADIREAWEAWAKVSLAAEAKIEAAKEKLRQAEWKVKDARAALREL